MLSRGVQETRLGSTESWWATSSQARVVAAVADRPGQPYNLHLKIRTKRCLSKGFSTALLGLILAVGCMGVAL